MQRDEYYDVPIEAIREVVNNAIAHRDYSLQGMTVKVYVHPDRVEVHSPGRPIHSLEDFRNFSARPVSRNPKIAYLFNQVGVVEEAGYGMRELKSLSQVQGLRKPSFRMAEDYLVTTIYTKYGAPPSEVDEGKLEALSPSEREGFDMVMRTGSITSPEYGKAMKVSDRTARLHLKHMVDNGLLVSTGAGKATVYSLPE